MKKLVFAPGNGEDFSSRNYEGLFESFREAGFDPTFVPIRWSGGTTVDDWHAQFREAAFEVEKQDEVDEQGDPPKLYYAGFSYGGIVAVRAAAAPRPRGRPPLSGVIACSLSPYFAEDMTVPTRFHRKLTPERRKAFQRLSFVALADEVTCPVELFVGDQELHCTIARADDALERLPNATLTEVEGVGHQVDHPDYMSAIVERLQGIDR